MEKGIRCDDHSRARCGFANGAHRINVLTRTAAEAYDLHVSGGIDERETLAIAFDAVGRCPRCHPGQAGLDRAESRWHSVHMTIILILTLALAAGVLIRSRWALLFPLAFGAAVAFALAAAGHAVDDTPIPFLVIVSTLVMIGGQGVRSRGPAKVV